MNRLVQPELLDELPFDDPRARWSRRDNPGTRRVGDRRSAVWGGVNAVLLDRPKNVTAQTLASFAPLGWQAEAVTADVFD